MTLKKISYSAISVLQVFLQMVFDFCRRKHFENTIFCEGLHLFNFSASAGFSVHKVFGLK
jgi:hypothetical protein